MAAVGAYEETVMYIHAVNEISAPIRIAVIDDHPMFRKGAVQLLTSAGGIEVVGEGATAADAIKVARERDPDIFLLDIYLPGGGFEAAAGIARVCLNAGIIMMTASEDEQDVTSALQVGARGYIVKGSSGSEVVETVRAVARGDSYVAPTLGARLLIKKGNRIETIVSDNVRYLGSRDGEVSGLVSPGTSNTEVVSLKSGGRTTKHSTTNAMRRLGVRNRGLAVLKLGPN